MKVVADGRERELAATTFDRNVVVTAGAGTGKTTLIVDRLVHLLLRSPEPLKVTEIVALTFTNKAADEMKTRLRERLQGFIAARLDEDSDSESKQKIQIELRALTARYRRTKDQIDALARDALRNIERSAIGTIHSFAAMLLRLYPMEGGLDPQFTEDDGSRFERLFEEQWALWLDQQLSRHGTQKEHWKQILRKISLEDLRSLAFCLAAETVPLDRLAEFARDAEIPAAIAAWLRELEKKGGELIRDRPADTRHIALLSRAAVKVIREILENGAASEGISEAEKELLATKSPHPVQGWTSAEVLQAKELVRVAKRMVRVDNELLRRLCDLLIPFVQGCRDVLISQGYVSFDGLLVRTRDLLRNHGAVREELKRQFKAILIDEFQDTDPIQYEIILYLGERIGQSAGSWQKVKLAPGKLFIVGDPKQSIYAFRRADIEAYLHVAQKMIERQGGIEYQLTTNFRSHKGLLDAVNGIFGRLIVARTGLQPSYAPIRPDDAEPGSAGGEPKLFRKVVLRKVISDETATADLSRRLEAESLARWLGEEVIDKATILNREREEVLVQPRDVAVLLRKLTDVHLYLEPLRRQGIPYVVEGERHFYATQEIMDAVNLLRAVENPYDRAALVGTLRSAVGGLQDRQIYDLHSDDLLDYRVPVNSLPQSVRDLYSALRALHAETRDLPVGEAVNLVFARIPVQILAARSFNGEQAVANLEKVRRLADRIGRESASSLREVIARLHRNVLDLQEEAESALAEESVNAVRILSVHKSKGLEFPVVVLAGCHSPVEQREARVGVQYDWSSNLVGLNVADRWNLPGIYLAEKSRQRSIEEQKRVFYVAMTRAREHLTLSHSAAAKQNTGTFLGLLAEAFGDGFDARGSVSVPAGDGWIESQTIVEKLAPPQSRKERSSPQQAGVDWRAYARFWERREEDYDAILHKTLFATPTSLKLKEQELAESVFSFERFDAGDHALIIGTLAHRFLEAWDFSSEWRGFDDRLVRFLDRFPDSYLDGGRSAILAGLREIFSAFFSCPLYAELCSTRILGREVPFVIPWNGQIMEGVIDLVYEKDGRIYLADYKTDRVTHADLPRKAQEYRHQVRIYSQAARLCLRREVESFRLVFVRLGEAVEVPNDRKNLQYTLSF